MKTIEHKLPTFWASALINGDVSGMEEDDIRIMDEFLKGFDLFDKECLGVADDSEFMLRPFYIHSSYELFDGEYSTFTFEANS